MTRRVFIKLAASAIIAAASMIASDDDDGTRQGPERSGPTT